MWLEFGAAGGPEGGVLLILGLAALLRDWLMLLLVGAA